MTENAPAHGLPEPRRRRVAPPIADPMAPPVLPPSQPGPATAAASQPVPTAPETAAAAAPTARQTIDRPAADEKPTAPRQTVDRPAAAEPPAAQQAGGAAPVAETAPAGLRRPRGQATVPLYVRIDPQTRARFDELAARGSMTARSLVEQLVDQAWHQQNDK